MTPAETRSGLSPCAASPATPISFRNTSRGSPPLSAQPAHAPYFGDRLAYVSGGQLYIGLSPKPRLVSGPGTAFHPVFSHDGRWLAFVRQPTPVTAELWLARGDGSKARRISS